MEICWSLSSKRIKYGLYYPHVGQSNHALGHPFRVGVWVDSAFSWLDDDRWERSIQYKEQTIVSDIHLSHPDLDVELSATEAVDFHENLLLRLYVVRIPSGKAREVILFFHHDFHINQNEVGDTAYYEPERRSVFPYKGKNWFMINGAVEAEQSPFDADENLYDGLAIGVHQWACGLKEIHNLQGTWRDAEDGVLSGNDVAHGSVDSTIGFTLQIPVQKTVRIWYRMAVAPTSEQVVAINRSVRTRGPGFYLDRTAAFWKLWLGSHLSDLSNLPESVSREYERSLLVIRTQIDNEISPNFISLCIQPDEGIHLHFEAKVPDSDQKMRSVDMDFHYQSSFRESVLPEAYERLLLEALSGNASLFTRSDGIEAAWRVIDPVIDGWMSSNVSPLVSYPPKTWGPDEANQLLAREGHVWRLGCID